ncbi:receptor-like protein 12 [Gossypium australe]|uniref:Receptor-like protein 12 n=1 Tax=Gossypium australe TaxID=47621 RepID=A0A5B6WJV0_9ROSI|nr:receptor-like protein 12 [Gossypium australe]
MDVIGSISPKPSNEHRFIFVVIDYFTKWVEAASYANFTKSAVSKFLKKEIICQYRMPERIISDNALNLNNSTIIQFKIKHHNSSPYRSKMNGAVEAANKNIKKIVGKMTETYKDWHEKLPFALYVYQTFVRTSTKQRLSHWFMEWRFVPENFIRGPGIEKDLAHTKRLQRKMDAKLGRTLCGKKAFSR